MARGERLAPSPRSASAISDLVSSPLLLPAPTLSPQGPSLRASDATWGNRVPLATGAPATPCLHGVLQGRGRALLAFCSQGSVEGGNQLPLALISILKELGAAAWGGARPRGPREEPHSPWHQRPRLACPLSLWAQLHLGSHPDFLLAVGPSSLL